jgi:hypothetical protein
VHNLRTAALERLLDSIRDNADPANIHKLCLLDDYRQVEYIDRNQDIVAAFGNQSAIATSCIGQHHRLLAEVARARRSTRKPCAFWLTRANGPRIGLPAWSAWAWAWPGP